MFCCEVATNVDESRKATNQNPRHMLGLIFLRRMIFFCLEHCSFWKILRLKCRFDCLVLNIGVTSSSSVIFWCSMLYLIKNQERRTVIQKPTNSFRTGARRLWHWWNVVGGTRWMMRKFRKTKTSLEKKCASTKVTLRDGCVCTRSPATFRGSAVSTSSRFIGGEEAANWSIMYSERNQFEFHTESSVFRCARNDALESLGKSAGPRPIARKTLPKTLG